MKNAKTILLTGANGYIGKYVTARLVDLGAHVVAFDRAKVEGSGISQILIGDVLSVDPSVLVSSLGVMPDVCLHLAWRNGFNHNDPSHIKDLSGHYSFLTGLADAGVGQIAVMGSMHEVGYWEGPISETTPCNPMSLYGIAKNTLREALSISFSQHDSLVFQWIRGFYVYGDDGGSQSIFGKIIQAAQRGEKTFPFTTGENKYDFLSVEELADQICSVIMQNEVDGIINCCSGTPISLAERVEEFIIQNELDISLEYGAFPDRSYDSPGLWGDDRKIRCIMKQKNN